MPILRVTEGKALAESQGVSARIQSQASVTAIRILNRNGQNKKY